MSLIKASSTFTAGMGTMELFIGVQSKIVAAVERAQTIVVQEAQALVPVRTGELRGSIHANPIVDDGKEITGTVSADAEHAAYVEFGTGIRGARSPGSGMVSYNLAWPGMPAQPYMRPAIDVSTAKILEEFHR